MRYIVSLSGGVASAVAAERAIERYGRAAVTLWFADVLWEDEDNYRFMADCMQRWGGELITYCDGRTPLQIAEHEQIIPNQRHAPCSRSLKIRPFVKFLEVQPGPVTVLLGLDWREQHRMAKPKVTYEALPGVTVDYPLMWQPMEFRSYQEVVREWLIEPPRMYAAGFSHANCGGRCVKQGIAEWNRLRLWEPDRFAEVRDWETAQRAKGGARANYSICRDQSNNTVLPLTLADIEKRAEPTDDTPSTDDMFACMCGY